MAKEADLKKIELNVSVNCCDGCKRKVKKVLQTVEGVLKTEIDPFLPKVTVIGNVDPQILIRRLLKAGKQAKQRSQGSQNAGKERNEAGIPVVSEKDKTKLEYEQAKSSYAGGSVADQNSNVKNGGDGSEIKAIKTDEKAVGSNENSHKPEVVKNDNPLPPHLESSQSKYPCVLQDSCNFRDCNQYDYKVEPCTIALPYSAVPSHVVASIPSTCNGQEYLYHERPVFQPPFQIPATRVGDYFSEENTAGCYVM